MPHSNGKGDDDVTLDILLRTTYIDNEDPDMDPNDIFEIHVTDNEVSVVATGSGVGEAKFKVKFIDTTYDFLKEELVTRAEYYS
jgi:hypothetical protein